MRIFAGLFAASLLAGALLAPSSHGQTASSAKHTFVAEGDHFLYDGKPFQVISGELHYARIPREYWRARMQMAKAMGLNTIATYVFWNVHEPRPGVYDFSGDADVAAFVRMAAEEGLHVLLRVGPYSCAEWEFGGYPAWLLADPKMSVALRSDDPAFMVPVERWIKRIARETAPLQIGRGGPILAVQVENEYGNFSNDQRYLAHVRNIFVDAGYTDAMLYTVSPSNTLASGSLAGTLTGVNFGTGNSERGLSALAKFRPGEPLFATEYWPGWFDHWGHPHETRSTSAQVKDLEYILSRGGSVNIYMFHGGTSFGFWSGASWTGGQYLPDVTSYDYDAPLDEAGHITPKFEAYREELRKYAQTPLPAPPATAQVIAIAPFRMTATSSLWDHLPAPIRSDAPKTMEQLGQAFGYILYRTQLPAGSSGTLVLGGVHDYAQVYLDGLLVGTVDRRHKDDRVQFDASRGGRLDLLVENSGRINSTKMMRGEIKGLTGPVTLGGHALTGWENFPLAMDHAGELHAPHNSRAARLAAASSAKGPHFAFGRFDLKQVGDTYLDVSALGKGALWINGHALGRFWNEGPQKTLYLPAPWLRKGANEVVAFDLFAPAAEPALLWGALQPILDAPTHEAAPKAPDPATGLVKPAL